MKEDKRLMLAYQKGILDERKVWQEVKKENNLLKFREKDIRNSCFCNGNNVWRGICGECQDWFKTELKERIKLIKNKYKPTLKDSTWDGVEETILEAKANTRGHKR